MRHPAISLSLVRRSERPGGDAVESLVSASGRFLLLMLTYSFPLFLLVVALIPWHPSYAYAWDFHAFYSAGAKYLHLHTPYVAPSLANLTSQDNFVYPLPVAALFAPISLAPYWIAAALFIALSALLLGVALRLLGVRDWRCYAAVYLSLGVQDGLKLGTISPLLVFLLAVLWRYRDRAWISAPALALLVVSKLFLWPVALWFIFTRRYRVFVCAALGSIATWVLTAVPLGTGVLTGYPHLLREVSGFESPQSFSLYALGLGLGLSTLQATAVAVVSGALVLIVAFRWARADESRAFRGVILAALLLSPIIWDHYLVLLVVPLALTRPRFSPVWLALAWVLFSGFVLGHVTFVLATIAVVLLAVLQADVIRLPARLDLSSLRRPPRLGYTQAMLLVWIPYLIVAVNAGGTVPVAAALRSPTGSNPSGTAFVRLATTGTSLCWRVWTNSVPPDSQVILVRGSDHTVLASHVLAANPLRETCVPLSHIAGRDLVAHFRNASGGYELVVRSAAGSTLLSGVVVRRVDAGSSIAQGGRMAR